MAKRARPAARDWSEADGKNHAERSFDPDAWGASPQRLPAIQESVYDDPGLDREHVPLAHSLLPGAGAPA